MDIAAPRKIRFNRLLPYWAVLQTDLRHTVQSWVFRLWVILTLAAATGYGLYKVGIHREAGLVQSASMHTGDLLRGVAVATLALVALLSVSAVSSERSTVADAIHCRGISRYQYFLAKWHARTVAITFAFAMLSMAIFASYHYLLDPDLTWAGGAAVTVIAVAALAAVIAWGVTVGALANGTLLAITLFWMLLYGVILLSSFLPDPFPTPAFVFARMRSMLRGNYESWQVARTVGLLLGIAAVGAAVGLLGYRKKDV
jgi:ABC-2 type transport system permease protein